MHWDYVIVGSGLTGAVIARQLADAGQRVIVLERRACVAGNVADYWHPCGIHVHRYGPHLFRTVSDDIWQFVNRFARFHEYWHQVKTRVDGQLENWPVAASYIARVCGDAWQPRQPGASAKPANFEEAALSLMPQAVYEKFVKGYTEKQWGVSAHELAAGLCTRFDVRHDDNPYLTPRAKHQGIPTRGYSRMVERMLEGIPVVLNFDYLQDRRQFIARKLLVFTGPIDEYFSCELGRLRYRGQQREHVYLPHVERAYPVAVINNPGEGDHVREIEWKHMMRPDLADRIQGTLLTRETPWTPEIPDDYEYPFPDEANRRLYEQYQALADAEPGVAMVGRLGEYRYYDMDHAISRAMTFVRQLQTRTLKKAA